MLKSDFNKVALQLYWNCTLAWVFSCNFTVYFQNTFSWGGQLSQNPELRFDQLFQYPKLCIQVLWIILTYFALWLSGLGRCSEYKRFTVQIFTTAILSLTQVRLTKGWSYSTTAASITIRKRVLVLQIHSTYCVLWLSPL